MKRGAQVPTPKLNAGTVISSAFRILSYTRRQRIKSFPGVLELQTFLRGPEARRQLATRDTLVCVEGFPRSGNTFCVTCVLEIPDVRAGDVAAHTHSTANVRRATALRIPTYVVIRDPLEASLSLRVMGVIGSVEDGIRAWGEFYLRLLPVLDRIVVVPFDTLCRDPYDFMLSVARETGKPLPPPRPDYAQHMLMIRRRLDRGATENVVTHGSVPHQDREELKRRMAEDALNTRLQQELNKAREVHADILKRAPRILDSSLESAGYQSINPDTFA